VERRFLTKQAPHKWPFSHGVIITRPEKFIALAGQVAYDRQGPGRQLVGPGDIEVQTRQVFENIKTLLTQAGATFQDVIELTVYLVDMNHFPICGQVAQEYVGDPPPAMNLIGVNALGFPELMVEITALAVQ
jgi:enamine deaminase RidA (YjgF/YER057c/UK114 family)